MVASLMSLDRGSRWLVGPGPCAKPRTHGPPWARTECTRGAQRRTYAGAVSAAFAVPFGKSERCSAGFSARVRLNAVLISATCENACGKLPRWRFARGSYSSLNSPTSLARPTRRLNSRSASSTAAEQQVGVGEPEAAGEERAFARRQSVARFQRVVAQHQPVDDEIALDRLDGRAIARIVRLQEADRREQQQAGVEIAAAVGAHEAVARLAPAMRRHVVADRVAHGAPAFHVAGQAEHLGAFDGAVERDPHHRLRVGEVLRRGAHLPDAVIRLAPDRLQMIEQRDLHVPAGFACRQSAAAALMQRVHHLAEHVELQLAVRRIADAHRGRVLVARAATSPPIR